MIQARVVSEETKKKRKKYFCIDRSDVISSPNMKFGQI
jgi:hypothetical protein